MIRLKKILCVFLAVLFILPASASFVGAAGETGLDFSLPQAVKAAKSVSGADLSFNANEGAMRVFAKGSQPSAGFSVPGASGAKYAVITYKNQKANSPDAFQSRIDFISGSDTIGTKYAYLTKGYKSYSSVINLSGIQSFDSIRITFFTSCISGDMLYLYGITFHDSENEAKSAAELNAKKANGEVISRYSEEQLTLNNYELERYVLPYWSSDIIYNEGVYPLLNRDGTIDDITLMYDASKIVSVRSSTLTTEYKEGVDYELVNGKLRILTSGNIPCVPYTRHYFSYETSGTYRMLNNKGWVRFQEGNVILAEQLAVTYAHTDEWSGFLPPNQGEGLPRTTSLLENGGDLDIVFFGDSITNGGNSSSVVNILPYAEMWTQMVEKELKGLYPSANITCKNTSISGGSAIDAKEHVYDAIIPYNPDLLILAIGTNDAQFKYDSPTVLGQMQYVVDAVKSRCPDCEIILIAPMFSNPECFAKDLFYEYRDGYYRMAEDDGIVVADIMAVHDYLLTRKSYTDMSANNLCHLNDFLARVYTQTVIKTITAENASDSYKKAIKDKLGRAVNINLYSETERALINRTIENARAAIDSSALVEEVMDTYRSAKVFICSLPKNSEAIASRTDFTKLIFDNSETVQLLTANYNVTSYYSSIENAAVISATGSSDPHTSVIFPKDRIVSANDAGFIVLTYKVPATNSQTSGTTQLFFCAGTSAVPTDAQSRSFNFTADGKYHSVVFDLSSYSWWSGIINQIRLDPFASCKKNDEFFLSSMLLCNDAAEALEMAETQEQIANGTYIGASSTVIYDSAEKLSLFGGEETVHIRGDMTGDNKINARDLLLIKKAVTGDYDNYNEIIADANGDSKINLSDVTYLKRVIVGSADAKTVVINSTPSNVKFNSETSAAAITPGDGFIRFEAEGAVEGARYAALVYKASAGCATSAAAILSDSKEDGAVGVTLVSDGDYNCVIIPIGANAAVSGIYFGTDGIDMEVDSFGLFETYKSADDFTYNRLWERKSSKVYNENIVVTFDGGTADKLSLPNNTAYDISASGVLKLTVTDGKIDPYIYLDLSHLGFSADEYKYVIYEYMLPLSNSSAGIQAEIFLCAGDTLYPTAGASTKFSVAKDASYRKWLVDLNGASYWSGDVHGIRLDYFCNADVGDTCYIKSVTFCKSQSDAIKAMNRK